MAESEFMQALRQDRAAKEAEILTINARLGPAREAQKQAREDRAEYTRARQSAKGWDPGYADPRSSELLQAETSANHIVHELENHALNAGTRIEEIDRLLNAASNAAVERSQLREVVDQITNERASVAQFSNLGATLQQEIDTLGAQRETALAEHGKAEITARLAGKSLPLPKAIAAIDADLESRAATLAAAQSAKADHEARLGQLTEERGKARQRLQVALLAVHELAYHEQIAPQLHLYAALRVLGSQIGFGQRRDVFTIRLDEDDLRAAAARLEAELATKGPGD